MPASSLLTLLDDIASVLDDVAVMTKKAAAKTAGVLGDDLALNAQQVSGVVSQRELPVVWAVAKGSFINKLILVPVALAISALAPWAIIPLLMVGGLYLCYEGCEKLAHKFLHPATDHAAAHPPVEPESEATKIKGAIRTDFVLSAEIIAITLGTVAGKGFTTQLMVLSAIAVLMTVGVYGLVAGIVKLDDAGLALARARQAFLRAAGRGILAVAPKLMKLLSVLGTAAMFLVGGGIVAHGIPPLHHAIEHAAESLARHGGPAAWVAPLTPAVLHGITGLVAGFLALLLVLGLRRLRRPRPAKN
jgi:predicted DNA repair protein MutK